jgi:hypothetical protein
VENGCTNEEFGALVGIFVGNKARPIWKDVWFVSVRMRDSMMAEP